MVADVSLLVAVRETILSESGSISLAHARSPLKSTAIVCLSFANQQQQVEEAGEGGRHEAELWAKKPFLSLLALFTTFTG